MDAEQLKAQNEDLRNKLAEKHNRVVELEASHKAACDGHEATCKLHAKEYDEMRAEVAKQAQRADAAEANAKTLSTRLGEVEAALAAAKSGAAEAAELSRKVVAERDAEIARLRGVLEKKNKALAPCLAGVAQQLELIKAAVEAE